MHSHMRLLKCICAPPLSGMSSVRINLLETWLSEVSYHAVSMQDSLLAHSVASLRNQEICPRPLQLFLFLNTLTHKYLLFVVVRHHNSICEGEGIRTVLCPGLGTAVGRMPVLKCAIQMRVAYEAVMFGDVEPINSPLGLSDCCSHHVHLYKVSHEPNLCGVCVCVTVLISLV